MEDYSSPSSVSFYDFLNRMRHPASIDLVRSIKSFLVSFSFYSANSDDEKSKKVQDFYLTMAAAIKDHPLWANASPQDIDSALEGLEKYVMTKLYAKLFASSPQDAEMDKEISHKNCLLQTFLRPDHLDIPSILQTQASWLLAEKELQKINAFRSPREKLFGIMSCCKVINNLLLNTSMSENLVLAGADDFLPLLIYITIKANPPQLHSNLKFIQLYRRQEKLVSEAAYYFTNLVSVKTFIVDLCAKSLSIDETEFEESMQTARLGGKDTKVNLSPASGEMITLTPRDPSTSGRVDSPEPIINAESQYPYMSTEVGDMTIEDVERLLTLYKDIVRKYTSLSRSVRHLSTSKMDLPTVLERTTALNTRPQETSSDAALNIEKLGN